MENGSKSWIQFALTVLEKGGPVTTLILGLCALAMIWGLYKELARVHAVSLQLFERYQTCQQAQLELARECATHHLQP